VKLLLDTHLLLWAAADDRQLSLAAREMLEDPANTLHVSAASLWEITIKHRLGRDDFRIDPVRLHRALLDNGYADLPISAAHALAAGALPMLHKDPFDRMLVAQATNDGLTLLTSDSTLARYPGPITCV
jgi:PIN domain nuclease of toxin-antitoxin system